MSDTSWLIKTEGLGKQYGSRLVPFGRQKAVPSTAWALRGISVEIGAGETVGIVGRNGGGKSTLLKLLSGVMLPTEGSARVRGRLDAMLELGTAFDPSLSGRANIELYVALLGLKGARAKRQFDEIVAFAELSQHVDQPMSTYSTGMFVRLAFAAQTSLAPQILVVDEALSVGDHFFQQKAANRIDGLVEQGTTLLFVSHDVGLMRRLCKRVLYLKRGRLVYDGDPGIAIRAYLQERPGEDDAPVIPVIAERSTGIDDADDQSTVFQNALWYRKAAGNDVGKILAVAITTPEGRPVTSVLMGGTIAFHVLFTMPDIPDVHVVIRIADRLGQWVTSTGSKFLGLEPVVARPGARIHFVAEIEIALEGGSYDFATLIGTMNKNSVDQIIDVATEIGPIEVFFDYENRQAPFLGRFGLSVKAHYRGELG